MPDGNDGDPASTLRKTEEGQYVLKVKGEERTVSEEELFRLAQLAEGANKRFEQAAEAEKKLGESQSALETLKKAYLLADQGDPEAFDQFLSAMGVGESIRKQKVQAFSEFWEQLKPDGSETPPNPEDDPKPKGGSKPSGGQTVTVPKELEVVQKLVDALGEKRFTSLIAELDQSSREKDQNQIYNEVFTDLEKNETLGKIMADKESPRARVLQDRAKEMIRDRIRAGGKYGPELRTSVAKDLAEFVDKFGAGSSSPTPIPGLGVGPSLSGIDAQADKKPERVPLTDDNYDERATQRLAHLVLQES